MVQATQTETVYTHSAEPRAAPKGGRYRNPNEAGPAPANNIMFDRRVVRGNTYAAQIVPTDTLSSTLRSTTRTNKAAYSTQKIAPRAATPDPVEGRRHMDVQTDQYLEEITDITPEVDVQTQTEAFIDRPPTPLFMPKKTGTDATTQIEAGDLFDFDFEVEPILEVLIGKVLEQGLTEVMEEEELKAMRAHQEHFEQIRNAELVATQRMEEAEKRKLAEKERRLAQERERVERERVLREKVAACAFARGYLGGLIGTVFQDLYRSGQFFDPVEREVASHFMPWLQEEALKLLAKEDQSRATARSVIEAALKKLVEAKAKAEGEREDEIRRKEEEARRIADEKAKREIRLRDLVGEKATFILTEMEPKVLTEEQVAGARAELEARHAAWAEGEYKLQREAAAMKARMTLAAAEPSEEEEDEEAEGEGEGEAAPEGEGEAAAPSGESEEVRKAVQEAMDAVQKPEPKPVTDILLVLHVYDGATPEFRQQLHEALRVPFPEEVEFAIVGPPPPPPSEYPATEAGRTEAITEGAEEGKDDDEEGSASSSEEEEEEK